MKYLYKYPHAAYPYEDLIKKNAERSRQEREYELYDTGIFENNNYFDVFVEYAKEDQNDLCIKITVKNQSETETAPITVLPTLWFRNTWAWGPSPRSKDALCVSPTGYIKPSIKLRDSAYQHKMFEAYHKELGSYYLHVNGKDGECIFTENETNFKKLYGTENTSKYCKDAFHDYSINNFKSAVNPNNQGTKAAYVCKRILAPKDSFEIRLRLTISRDLKSPFDFDYIFATRKEEADEFYDTVTPFNISEDLKAIQRQAFAGLLWSKQFYYFVVQDWYDGDINQPKPPAEREFKSKNRFWRHMHAEDILSMPDKWEYPFFAAWDSAFHTIPFAMIDPEFAKNQLLLLTREWYMHPNGQIPAYEWNFNDVNPPVTAWAAYRIFKIEKKLYRRTDYLFLERVFQKLLLNFTWWVNRKDEDGVNIFEGGFLGLDNIGVFNRSEPLPNGGRLRQADGTSWMAMYCLNMLDIALELAVILPAYEDIASKFFEHFLYISDALSHTTSTSDLPLWDEHDGFYYDVLVEPNGSCHYLKVRSLVGLIPLYACLTLEPSVIEKLPNFKRRMDWFLNNRCDLTDRNIASITSLGVGKRRLLAVVNKERLTRILEYLLSSEEFLSSFGFRSLSKYHKDNPYIYAIEGKGQRKI
jgi:hypothetical protein